jgi:hypothetical protein
MLCRLCSRKDGALMENSRNRFASLEAMCLEKAALAKKEMEYWQSEASEWKQLREASAVCESGVPVQLDWCAPSNAGVAAE